MQSGYDQIYLGVVARLAQCDLTEHARRLGFDLASGSPAIGFLGRDFSVTARGVEPLDGLPAHVNNRSVLGLYMLSEGSGIPGSSFVSLLDLAGTAVRGAWDARWSMARGAAQEIGSDYRRLEQAAEMLGGTYEPTGASTYTWFFQLLPKIPAQLVFHEGDDEFPPDMRLLFDVTAVRFLEFECLNVLSWCFFRALKMVARTGNVRGWDKL